MSPRRSLVALAVALLLAASLPEATSAQDDPAPVVYASYFQCEPGSMARASEIILDSWGPIAQAHIDSGDIMAWGSLTHHTGGEWSRAVYHVAADAATMLETLDEMGAEWNEADPEAVEEFWDACDEHEDYVWTRVAGSQAPTDLATERPAYGMSVYWTCDEASEPVADLIAEHVWAEYWDAQVAAGLIDSWGWLAHYMGDKYRRLLVVDGASHTDLLQARTNVIQAMGESSAALATQFNNVCNGHVDYLWNIEAAAP